MKILFIYWSLAQYPSRKSSLQTRAENNSGTLKQINNKRFTNCCNCHSFVLKLKGNFLYSLHASLLLFFCYTSEERKQARRSWNAQWEIFEIWFQCWTRGMKCTDVNQDYWVVSSMFNWIFHSFNRLLIIF